jgi:4-diphosphocytidyl-2-C-methyl-D-erythritol kinase
MVFADIGDEVSLASGPRPALSLTGPFGAGLAAGDNLVLQAARRLARELGRAEPPPALVLDKRLPVAAGLGGGSADAAATLRLLNIAWGGRLSAGDLEILAADLGSDVPACVRSRPVIATGRGEVLTPAPDLPALPAVLVNPGVACPTGAVYRAFDAAGRFGDLSPPPQPPTRDGVAGIARWLSGLRNDLEAPAASVSSVIAIVLERLQAAPETLLADGILRLAAIAQAMHRLGGEAQVAHYRDASPHGPVNHGKGFRFCSFQFDGGCRCLLEHPAGSRQGCIEPALIAEERQIADQQGRIAASQRQAPASGLAVVQHLVKGHRQGGGMAQHHHG